MAVINKVARFSVFNFLAWGDIGPFTLYKGHQCQIVIFAKTWPDKPPSQHQLDQRAAFRAGVDAWWALSEDTREQWRLACRRASLTMTGFNLYLHYHLSQDVEAIRTLERQTSTTLLPP